MTTAPSGGTPQSGPNQNRSSKKMASTQSLNHLLNFSLPPRQTHQYQSLPRRKKSGAHPAVWNKERFVNAQYRFVMNPSGDYTVHFADPDIYFQWQDVLQVIIPRTSALASASGSGEASHEEGVTTCPICLSPPTAPRMTKCGHVFCYPCILHYLNTSDNTKWVRCPICIDSVNQRQLKAVKWIDNTSTIDEEDEVPPTASSSSATAENTMVSTPAPGTMLRMRLMQRPQITTLALPRSRTWPSDLIPPHQAPFHFLPDVHAFARFMLATPTALIADLTNDLDDLATERRILASMQDDLGVSFVDAADEKVRQQMAKAAALETPQLKEAVEAAHFALQQIDDRAAVRERKVKEDQARSAAPLADAPSEFLASRASSFSTPTNQPGVSIPATPAAPSPTPTRSPRQRRNVNPPPSASSYYFYQAASGMPIFLHPLDIKILLSHFGSYSAFPDTITARVESCAESTVNEDLRKRCKYLAHLPEGADVVFVEADLEGVVGRGGLRNFERALAMRRARREQKGRKDDKARARAEERERERRVQEWNELTRQRVDAHVAPAPRAPSPALVDVGDLHEFPEPGHEPPPAPASAQQASGVWGARSFASAAQHPSQGARPVPAQRAARRGADEDQEEDEWDLDVAFHELEQRAGRGGGRRRNNRLVVLGGGGGRRR